MLKSMRIPSRFAPLLAACAFALAASLSAVAGETKPVAVTPVAQVTATPISGNLSTPQGESMALQLAELEKDLIRHLKGEQPSSFEALDKRRKDLKARIDAAGLVPADKKTLDERLGRSASVIMRSLRLSGGASALDPELAKAVASAFTVPNPAAAKDPLYQIDALLGELDRAAANPADAEKIFDNLNRKYGAPAGPGGAVGVNFDAIRKTIAVTYTPDGAPGTNAAKARNLGRDMPAPAPIQEPVAVRGESIDYLGIISRAGGTALDELRRRIPNGGPPDFSAERAANLKELWDTGRAAVRAMLGDPDSFTSMDMLVAHLVKNEASVARSFGLPAQWPTTEEEITSRFDKIASVNPELAAFSAALWAYRAFLRESVRSAPVGTRLAPWETYPQGAGTMGAEVFAVKHDGTDFIGLRYDAADKSTLFEAFTADGKAAVRIVKDARGAQEIVRQNFDGEGEVLTQIVERLGVNGRRVELQRYTPKTHETELTTYGPDGKVLRTERGNSQTGDAFIQQIGGPGPRFEARITRDSREVKYTDQATAPYQLQVDHVNPDGSIELNFRVMKDGRTLKQLTKHVRQVIKDKVLENWDVSLDDLPSRDAPDKRKAAALLLAKEVLAAIGEPDPDARKAAAFADFLNFNAIAEGAAASEDEPAIRLSIAPGSRKVFTLILQRPDGTRTVLTGFFGERTVEPGLPKAPAYLVQNAVEFDADWNMKNASNPEASARASRVAHEYLGGGARIFREDMYKTDRDAYGGGNWNPGNWVANKEEVRHFFFRRQTADRYAQGGWAEASRWEGAPDIREKPGSAPFSIAAQAIVNVPGISHVLKGSNYVSNFLYTGVVNIVESSISGDLAKLNSVATRSRNPAWAYSIAGTEPDGEKEPAKYEAWAKKILAELTPGARALLDKRVMEMRPERLKLMDISEDGSPLYYQKAMAMAPTDLEAYFTLSEFGAGTYGKQLARNGYGKLAVVASAGEALGQMLTNPLTWAMPYAFAALGKLATSLGTKALVATEAGATGTGKLLTVAKWGVNAGKAFVVGSVGIPFVLDAVHKTHEAITKLGTPDGSVALGEALVDLGFIYGMGRSMGKDFAGTKFGKGLLDRFRLKSEPVKAPPVVVEAPVVKVEPAVVKAEPLVGPNGQLLFDFMRDQPKTPAPAKPAGAPVFEAPVKTAPVVESVAGPKQMEFDFTRTHETSRALDLARSDAGKLAQGVGDPGVSAKPGGPTRASSNGPPSAATVPEKVAAPAKPVVTEAIVPEKIAAGAKPVAAEPIVPEKVAGVRGPKVGEQLIFEFMKGEPKADPAKIAKEPAKPGEGFEYESRQRVRKPGQAEYKQLEFDFMAKRGTQLEFEFMKGKSEPKVVELAEDPAKPKAPKAEAKNKSPKRPKSEYKQLELDFKAKPEARIRVREGLLRRVGKVLLAGGHIGLAARILPPTPRPRPEKVDRWKTLPEKVNEPAPERKPDEPTPDPSNTAPPETPPGTSGPGPDERTVLPPPPPDPKTNTTGPGANPGGGPGGGGDGGGPSGKGPKAPSFGGFGGGGGGGGRGGGPAGNGADGGGGGGPDGDAPRGGGARPGPVVSAAAPADLLGGGPVIPVNRGTKAAPNDTAAAGGHSPTPSLAARFDGSRSKPGSAYNWSPTGMKGLGAGDSPGLPRLTARAPGLSAPDAADVGTPTAATAGGPVRPGVSAAPGVKPDEEDFSYTYMAPARHKYELPIDRPAEGKDWRHYLALGLRGAAALAIGYLIYHSDFPYLLGLTRRRRDGTHGV